MLVAVPDGHDAAETSKFELAARCVNDALDNASLDTAQSMIKAAGCAVLSHRKAITRKHCENLKFMKQYHDEVGQPAVDNFFKGHQALVPLKCDVLAVPSASKDLVLQFVADPLSIVAAAQTCVGHSGQADDATMRAATECFSEGIEMIMHHDCPTVPSAASAVGKPPCWKVKTCLCGGELYQMRNGFLACMKLDLRSKDDRLLVRNRKIVVRLHGELIVPDDPYEARMQRLYSKGGDVPDSQVLWWAVGYHSFSPYRPCFKEMIVDTQCAYDRPGEVALTVPLN